MIDTLHLFLRISDVLTQLLIQELKLLDSVEKRKFSNGFDVTKCLRMKKYQDFINGLNINFTFNVNKDTKQIEVRDLTGPEKIKVFENIDILTTP